MGIPLVGYHVCLHEMGIGHDVIIEEKHESSPRGSRTDISRDGRSSLHLDGDNLKRKVGLIAFQHGLGIVRTTIEHDNNFHRRRRYSLRL
jgi:hypothetical protein